MHIDGKTQFVGVVSDALYGVAAQDLLGPLTSSAAAKKSWYFFDNEYVALGAGLINNVNTTIDQRWTNGTVTVATGSTTSSVLAQGLNSLKNTAWWVHHDAIGYIFPDVPSDFSLVVDTRTKSGNWKRISPTDRDATGNTFLMYIPRKTAQTYAYIVVPVISATSFASSAATTKSSIQILSNTVQIQAVYHTGLKRLHATFWVAQQTVAFPAMGVTITALVPSLLMATPIGTSYMKISLSDPTQLRTWAAISINAQFECYRCKYSNGVTVMNVSLPQAEYAGQTVIATIMRSG